MTWIISFVLKNWKIVAIGAAILGILYVGKLWLNKHDTQIREQERVAITKDMEAQKKAEWEERNKSLDIRATELDQRTLDVQALSVAAAGRLLAAERAERITRDALAQVITQSKTTQEVLSEAAKVVPVSELPDAIRRQSSRIAAVTAGPPVN